MGNGCAPAGGDSQALSALKRKGSSPGFVALFVIALIAALAEVGIKCYWRTESVNRVVQIEIQSRQALYEAEGGLAWAKARLVKDDTGGNDLPSGYTVNYGTGQASVKIAKESGGYWVTSEGKSGKCVRKLKAYLTKAEGTWVMLYYQEVYT